MGRWRFFTQTPCMCARGLRGRLVTKLCPHTCCAGAQAQLLKLAPGLKTFGVRFASCSQKASNSFRSRPDAAFVGHQVLPVDGIHPKGIITDAFGTGEVPLESMLDLAPFPGAHFEWSGINDQLPRSSLPWIG
jgi:hypothetical protein